MSDEAPRLSAATLDRLDPRIEGIDYARAGLVPGIVHFGPGAFHRAHQAAYADAVLAQDPRWAISAVALNSTEVAEALRPQDGLYTLSLLGAETRRRVIGSIVELPTRGEPGAISARLAAPATRLVTATVTEKGYHLTADGGLDFSHPAVRADLQTQGWPSTLVGWIVHGLARRRAEGAGALTLLSCDNLSANGRRLARAVDDFARARDPDLAAWIAGEARFPSCMVDSITPATDAALRACVQGEAGVRDAWPIQRETFTQWVIEDDFAGERPPFDAAGAQFTADVAPFEEAKLRLLNGAHSTLAYLGLLLGMETVRDAMADAELAGFVAGMMREEVAPLLAPAPSLDLDAYIDAVLARFRNPAIEHRLSQIAWDGSQKLPIRLLSTLAEARAAGRPRRRLVTAVAAWLRFVAMPRPPAPPLVDPLSDRLLRLAARGPAALVAESGVFPAALAGDEATVDVVLAAHAALADPPGVRNAIRALSRPA